MDPMTDTENQNEEAVVVRENPRAIKARKLVEDLPEEVRDALESMLRAARVRRLHVGEKRTVQYIQSF